MEYINFLINNKSFKILCILIVLDTIFRNIKSNKRKRNKFRYRNRRNNKKSRNVNSNYIFGND